MGRTPERSSAALQKAVDADPANAAAWCALGDALHRQGSLVEACRAYRGSVARDAGLYAAWWGLGCALASRHEHAEAAEALSRAVALQPQKATAWQNLGKARFEIGCVDEAIDAMRRAAELEPDSPIPRRGIAVAIPGDARADAAAIRDARRAWTARAFGKVAAVALPSGRSAAVEGRRLRVGYLSAFFRDANYMKPVWTLVNRHRRDRFVVALLSDNPRESVDRAYVAHPDDRFVALHGLGNAEAAARIAALDLDLLVDLNGYSAPDRLGVVAARPARRVLAWFNTFATSGLDAYDALIADAVVAPPGAEVEFEEPLVRLPFCHLTFEVAHPAPDVVPPPVLQRGSLTFGALSPLYKLVPEVVQAHARILRACPGGRLFIKAGALHSEATSEHLRRRYAEHGVAADALVFKGPAAHFQFLEAYANVDVALDTFPYGGATTTTEGLWQGVPTITFAGDRWAGRLGASVMRHAGLDEFVADSVDGYVAKAIELFHDPATPARLAALRAGMRERLGRSAVCDGDGFTLAMEAAYEALVQAPARV